MSGDGRHPWISPGLWFFSLTPAKIKNAKSLASSSRCVRSVIKIYTFNNCKKMPHFQFSFISNGIEYVWAVAERELELNTIPKLRKWQGRFSCGQGCLADSASLTDWPLCIPGACRGSAVWAERSRYDCNALLVTGPSRGTWPGTCAMLWLAGMWIASGNFWLLGGNQPAG